MEKSWETNLSSSQVLKVGILSTMELFNDSQSFGRPVTVWGIMNDIQWTRRT